MTPKTLKPGDRVRIISSSLPWDVSPRTGTVVEHRPQNGGYMVKPDAEEYTWAGGFGYSELDILPPATKTRWDRILEGAL